MPSFDEQRLNAFLAARGFLERGQGSIDGTAPGAMAAVVLYDLAVETAAKATLSVAEPTEFLGKGYVLRAADRSQGRDPTMPLVFDKLLASARENRSDPSLDVGELRAARKLHDLRNSVQHDALVPSSEDLGRARFRAVEALEWLCRTFFSIELAEISRASLILDEDVRREVQAAEIRASNEAYGDAAEALARAFELARISFRSGEPVGRSRARLDRFDVDRAVRELGGGSGRYLRSLARVIDAVATGVQRTRDRVEALTLGARLSEYEWFRRTFPTVIDATTLNSRTIVLRVHRPPDRTYTRDIYLRGLDFVTTTAIHWQQFPTLPAEAETNN